jgi:hypothetical protein
MPEYKEVHFKIPKATWERLFQIFPLNGERTGFFRQCAIEAVRMGKDSRFVQQLKRRIEEEE